MWGEVSLVLSSGSSTALAPPEIELPAAAHHTVTTIYTPLWSFRNSRDEGHAELRKWCWGHWSWLGVGRGGWRWLREDLISAHL